MLEGQYIYSRGSPPGPTSGHKYLVDLFPKDVDMNALCIKCRKYYKYTHLYYASSISIENNNWDWSVKFHGQEN